MVQRWLTFVLDVTIAFLAVIIVTLAVTLKASGGLTGVALTQVLSLNLILTSIIIAWTALETSIESVSRIKHFTKYTPFRAQAWRSIPTAIRLAASWKN